MDRRPFSGDQFNGGGDHTPENFQPVGSQSGSLPPGNVHFYEGLMHGLENLPPINSAGSSSSFAQNWSVGGNDRLGSFPQPGYGGWTSYPTAEDGPYPGENSGTFINTGEYFQSLSQPDSTSSSESGLFTTRSRSHSEHFDVLGGISSVDFTRLVQGGRDIYAESIGQWNNRSTTNETGTYDPFGTAHVLQQQQQQQLETEVRAAPSKSTKSCAKPIQPQPQPRSATPDPSDANLRNKPSYSDVAKNKPADATNCSSKKKEPQFLKPQGDARHGFSKPNVNTNVGFPDFSGVRPPPNFYARPRSAKHFKPKKRPVLEPTTIKPDSRYGLDTFDEPVKVTAGDHLSVSSGSTPQSRKGSTSSGAGSYCGVDDIDPIEHLKRPESPNGEPFNVYESAASQPWVGVKYDPKDLMTGPQGAQCQDTSPAPDGSTAAGYDIPTTANKSDEGKRKTQTETPEGVETKRPRSSSCNTGGKVHVKQNPKPEPLFFDPKRIFSPRPKAPAEKRPTSNSHEPHTTSNCIPNNQQVPSPDHREHQPKVQLSDLENVLNNDKPKPKLNSDNHSCYINNNLRESSASSKKQTNTDADRESGSVPDHSGQENTTSSSHGGRPGTHPRQRSGTGSSRREQNSQQAEVPPFVHNKPGGRKPQPDWDQQYFIGELVVQLWQWAMWATQELGYVMWNISKLTISLGLALFLMVAQYGLTVVKSAWIIIQGKLHRSSNSNFQENATKKTRPLHGLKENIVLPSTGQEAMKRLLAGKGKDPYSILGVRADASDEVIKKYYRKQAMLVHPDKNQMPGAEEAFKILGHAFDLIGEPEKRKHFDSQRLESVEEEEALHQFADLLSKLHEKMQEASNLMRCENCGGKHRRVPTERPMYAARYCQRCDYNHPVREGDVWAESHMLGFLWNYFACMENRVYDITEWASCQCDRFKHIQANAHHVVYRIATNSNTGSGNRHRQNNSTRSNEADLEDLLNHLFHQTAGGATSGAGDASENFSQYTQNRPGTTSWSQANTTSSTKKSSRRRKKRH